MSPGWKEIPLKSNYCNYSSQSVMSSKTKTNSCGSLTKMLFGLPIKWLIGFETMRPRLTLLKVGYKKYMERFKSQRYHPAKACLCIGSAAKVGKHRADGIEGEYRKMKTVSYNANGIRARLPLLLEWMRSQKPDILCIQETKVQDKDFPQAPFEEIGYHCAFKGQKSFNGVAIFSRVTPNKVQMGFDGNGEDEGPRLISAYFSGVTVINTYIPQGQSPDSEKFAYKLEWYQRLHDYFARNFSPDDPLIWVGDFNVAPQSIDVYDPKALLGSCCYHPEEHKALAKVMAWGFTDVYRHHRPEEKQYTFWDYRIPNAFKRGLGWRIDHICATQNLIKTSKDAWIDTAPRLLPKPSDHTFILAEFDVAV